LKDIRWIHFSRRHWIIPRILVHILFGKQEFRRTDFGSRLLAAEGEGGGVCLKWSNILLVVARSPRLKSLRRNSCYPLIYFVLKVNTLLYETLDRFGKCSRCHEWIYSAYITSNHTWWTWTVNFQFISCFSWYGSYVY
jgi:hypothetical protein